MLNQASGVESFILDSEIVAIDPKAESLQSFQDLSGRARKDVKIEDVSIPVCVFAFDLMSLNGEVCIKLEIRGSALFLHPKATAAPNIPTSSRSPPGHTFTI